MIRMTICFVGGLTTDRLRWINNLQGTCPLQPSPLTARMLHLSIYAFGPVIAPSLGVE